MVSSNKIIQGLWVNGNLKRLQRLSIQSFLDYGHEFHLYTYEKEINAPKGTIIKPADEIISEAGVFLDERGSLTAFADLFRYELLYEKGGWWVDLDTICLKPFDFEEAYVFSSSYDDKGEKVIHIGTFKVPAHSKVMRSCADKARCLLNKEIDIKWELLGKDLLIESLEEEKRLKKYIQGPNVFSPLPWYYFRLLYIDVLFDFTPEVYAVHFYNEMLRINKIDSNQPFHKNSYFERLYKKHFSLQTGNNRSKLKQ